jgi:hypothetical protein
MPSDNHAICHRQTIGWPSMPFQRIFLVMLGWKIFSSGQISALLPAVSDVFPFRVSLYIASRGEEYSTSCGRIKSKAYNVSYKQRIYKNTFVKPKLFGNLCALQPTFYIQRKLLPCT